MPKLLQINVTANWGSTGKIAEQIGLCAMKHGWISYIAYGRYSNPSRSRLIQIGSKIDTYIHFFKQRFLDNEGLNSKRATLKLIKKIEEIKPDIVHLHNIHDHYLNYKILFNYLNSTNIHVVWTMHDFWGITGHCMHFAILNCDAYRNICHNCPMHKVYPKTLLDQSSKNFKLKKELFSSNKNLVLVPVSNWVGEILKQSFLKDKRIQVIPNGIDTSVFKPTFGFSHPNIKATDHIILGVATKWNKEKGLNDYIALSQLLPNGYVIILVGMSDSQIKEMDKFNLDSNKIKIIGLPLINNIKDLAALYTRADVITILSRAETFGLTVVEGYACGTPAIVYDNTAPPLLITENTGRIVKTGDISALCKTIINLKKINFKKNHSAKCRQVAIDQFDMNKCFERYIQLYQNIL